MRWMKLQHRSKWCSLAMRLILGVILVTSSSFLMQAQAGPADAATESGAVIVTVDGLDWVNTLFNDVNMGTRAQYLKPAIEDMGIPNSSVDAFGWNGNAYETKWILSDPVLPDLEEFLEHYSNIAAQTNKKFIVVSHSWGTVLTQYALSDLGTSVSPDLYITLSSPLGSFNVDKSLDEAIVSNFVDDRSRELSEWKPDHNWFGATTAVRQLNYWIYGDLFSGPVDPYKVKASTIDDRERVVSSRSEGRGAAYAGATGAWHAYTTLNKEWDFPVYGKMVLPNQTLIAEVRTEICQTAYGAGGVWIDPENGATVTDSVHFAARAYSGPGSSPVDHVNFTAWWPALGPENGPWLVVSQQYSPAYDDVYEYDWNLAGAPYGEVKISFDVYDESGNRNLAPNGTRTIVHSSDPVPPDPPCSGGTWSVGQRVFLKKGAEIRVGSGDGYTVHTIVPEDGWAVDVIGGPRCIDGNDWWDISRANLDGGGTGWVNRVQAEYVPTTPTPDPPADGIRLFDGANYSGASRLFTVGKYSNLADYSWYDRVESIRFEGNYVNNYHVVLCSEKDFSGDPGHYESDAGTLGTAQQNHVRSVEIYKKDPGSGIVLYDGENYSGESVFIPVGKIADLTSIGFWDRAESIRFVGDCAGGRAHAVLSSEKDFQGDPGHYELDSPTFGEAQRNHVRSVELYKHQIPVPPQNPHPANGAVLDRISTSLDLSFDQIGSEFQIHVWSDSYDVWRNWDSTAGMRLDGLIPGQTYYWQAQARNIIGESPWGPQWSFTTAALPELANLDPNGGAQGDVLTAVQVNGNHLTGATALDFTGEGVVCSNLTVITDTEAWATITIDPEAIPGPRDVSLTTPLGTSTVLAGGFTVAIAPVKLDSSSLFRVWDGTPKVVTATTYPPGLDYTVTYNGSTSPPVDVGIYEVEASITSSGYAGHASGFLRITSPGAPSVSIVSPLDDCPVVGTTDIQGIAFDPDGNSQLQSVEVRIDDGDWVLTQGTTKWNYSWDTAGLTPGEHEICARSYDGQEYSNEASVTVVQATLYSLVFGNGQDGGLVITGSVVDSPIDSACSGTAGSSSLVATNASFVAGQAILIHQSQGANAGQWERNLIQEYVPGEITLQAPLKNTYSAGCQALVLRQYTDVTVDSGATWSAKAWNGTTGGILAFLANGTVSVLGTISASGKGFRGGAGGLRDAVYAGQTGESSAGIGPWNGGDGVNSSPNGSGGRGGYGRPGGGEATGGGGGGHALAGSKSARGDCPGGSASTDSADLSTMLFGAGGGGGGAAAYHTNPADEGAPGGPGGGILLIAAATLVNGGTIAANGNSGANSLYPNFMENGGGGGGAGGAILTKVQTGVLGSSLMTANGGAAGNGDHERENGGAGSIGRIHIDYYASLTGTTTPPADARKLGTALVDGATIILDSLVQDYDGNPKSVTYTTNPPGLTASLTYSRGGLIVHNPTYAGNYDVSATITTPGYVGSATGTFTIAAAPALAAPTLSYPADLKLTTDNTPWLDWSDVTGPSGVHYEIEVDDGSDFASSVFSRTWVTSSSCVVTTVLPDTTYWWRVRAVDDAGKSSEWTDSWSFTVDATAPSVPTLSSPASGRATTDSTPWLDWSDVSDATGVHYQIEVGNDAGFTSPAFSRTWVNASSCVVATALPDGLYYWRVRAIDGAGNPSAWTSAWSFTVDATTPPVPVLASPSSGKAITDSTPWLDWSDVTDTSGVHYQIQVDNNADFSSLAFSRTWVNSSSCVVTTVLADGTYYWRVKAVDGAGNASAWTSAWSVVVDTAAPSLPVLSSPSNGRVITDTTPWLDWTDASDATAAHYQIQVDNDPGFTSLSFTRTWVNSSSCVVTTVLSPGTYYWRVRAVDAAGNTSAWTAAWSFTVQ